MPAFLKQTIKKTLFLFICALSLQVSAWGDVTPRDDCKTVIEYLSNNLVAPTDIEAELICKYIEGLYSNSSERCPTPANLQAVVNRNTVTLSWEQVSQSQNYLLSALNVTDGREQLARTDRNSYTFNNLAPGTYVFSVQSVCGENIVSPPALASSIIIGDIAVIMPNQQEECVCTEGVLQYSGGAFPPQLLVPWEDELGCQYGIYEISMIINSIHFARIEVSYQPGDNIAVVNVCNTKRMKVRNDVYTVTGNTNSGVKLVEMEFSEDYGIVINPQISLYSYEVHVTFCCMEGGNYPGEIPPISGKRNASASNIAGANILQASPNPFDQSSVIEYNTQKDTEASLILYNSQGQAIRFLHRGTLLAGNHQAILEGDDLAPGLYYLRFESREQNKLLKMIKL